MRVMLTQDRVEIEVRLVGTSRARSLALVVAPVTEAGGDAIGCGHEVRA